MADEDMQLNDPDRIPVYYGHYPSGASFKSIDHFAQIIETGEFKLYDHGPSENIRYYNSSRPPMINLTNIKNVPIAMFVGTKDLISTPFDN